MKRFLTLLCLCAFAISACAQTPIYLQGPAPKGRQVLALQAVAYADAWLYDAYTTDLGTSSIGNPTLTQWQDDFGAVCRACAAIHARRKKTGGHFYLRVRLLQNVPAQAFQNSVAVGPSYWAATYNGGAVWPNTNRPPLAVSKAISVQLWNVAAKIAVDAYGADAKACVSFQGTNELGTGGNGDGGQGGAMGWIEPYAGTMVYVLTSNFDAQGCRYNPVGFEGDRTKATNGLYAYQNEINSITRSSDWALVFAAANVHGVDFNRYGSYGTSAATVASTWATNASTEVVVIHANPLMAGRPVFIQEMGDAAKNWPTSRIDIPRQALVARARKLTNVEGASFFTAYPTNGATIGFNLWSSAWAPIGGNVGPLLIGGTS